MPEVVDEQLAKLTDQLSAVTAKLNRKQEHMQRTARYYDDAPDGSRQKFDAEQTLNRLSSEINVIEREVGAAVDALIAYEDADR